MLNSDPRFLEDVRRVVDSAPSWKPCAQSTNARNLAPLLVGLAGIGPAAELIQYGGVDFRGGPMMGSAILLLLAAQCWRVRGRDEQKHPDLRRIPPPRKPTQWRKLGRASDRVRERKAPLRAEQAQLGTVPRATFCSIRPARLHGPVSQPLECESSDHGNSPVAAFPRRGSAGTSMT